MHESLQFIQGRIGDYEDNPTTVAWRKLTMIWSKIAILYRQDAKDKNCRCPVQSDCSRLFEQRLQACCPTRPMKGICILHLSEALSIAYLTGWKAVLEISVIILELPTAGDSQFRHMACKIVRIQNM